MRKIRLAVCVAILLSTTLFAFQNCAPASSQSAEFSSTQSTPQGAIISGEVKNNLPVASVANNGNPVTVTTPKKTPVATTTTATPVKQTTPVKQVTPVPAANPKIGVAQGVSIMKDGKGLCNAVSFSQLPTDVNYFLGRVMNSSPNNACDGTDWSIGLFKMDWSKNTLNFVKYVFRPSVTDAAGNKIDSAYDPHVIQFNGELWVAFECAGSFGTGASSCIAPFTVANGVDTKRLTVIVRGTYNAARTEVQSGSVPKLLSYKGKLYIYWTACRFDVNKDGGLILDRVFTRGAEVVQDAQKKMWIKGSVGISMYAGDPSLSVEVWGGTSGDSLANHTADVFDFFVKGDTIYAVAAVGQFGCITPLSAIYGCYRTRIASSTSPLGYHIFNKNYVSQPELPFNPMEYTRFFKNPDGSHFMMGQYVAPSLNGMPKPNVVLNGGFQKYAVDLNNLKMATAVSDNPKPVPAVNSIILNSTFTVTQLFHRSCNYLNPTDVACNAAASRYCQAQGYLSGTGVLQHNVDNLTIACVGKSIGVRVQVNLSELTARSSSCTQISTPTGPCQSAVFHHCRAKGYEGGFGPQEAGGNDLTVTCLKASNAFSISSTFTSLASKVSACNMGSVAGDSCRAAVDVICREQGGVGGYGVHDYVGNNVAMGCIRN